MWMRPGSAHQSRTSEHHNPAVLSGPQRLARRAESGLVKAESALLCGFQRSAPVMWIIVFTTVYIL
jgi:hypothetical protein